MYTVSQDYLTKLYSGSIERRIRGYVDNIAFTENDIMSGSFKYVEKCVNSADIKLGGVFVGQFEATFLPSFVTKITRGTWRGRVITFSIGLLVDPDNDTWEDIPCKPYIIDEATHSKNGVSVTAYDRMTKFDKNFNLDQTSGTLYDFAAFACSTCGVTLGMTSAQMAELPNGTYTLALYPNNDIETWRDLISWVAATCGGYATINRAGALEFRTWHTTPDFEIDINDRFTGGSWSDFETYYTGLSVVNMEDEKTEYINVLPDTGLTMNLGSNPLIQYGTSEVKQAQRMNILMALQDFVYTPFNSTSLIDPFIDLGDVVAYTNGLAGDEAICCVHAMTFTYSKGMKLTGYGKNPALFGAQSKTDKNISGLLAKESENAVITHTFVNAAEIELVEDVVTPVIKINFATINTDVVKLLSEIMMDVDITSEDGVATVTAYYYLDGELIEGYQPQTTWDNDGLHLMHLLYWLENLTNGARYSWEVRLEIEGGTATIDRNWLHSILEAQGLVAIDKWDGLIEVEDEYTPIALHDTLTTSLSDTAVVSFITPMSETVSDTYTPIALHDSLTTSLSDNVSILFVREEFYIGSEDGEYILGSEDGNYIIRNEE